MDETHSGSSGRLLNGAELRVLGGVLVGIGVGPLVVGALTLPLGAVFDAEVVPLFRFAVNLLLGVLGLVVLHAVRLFYPGDWRSLDD
ncbi:hypothetical protein [Halosimplex marinum]|uniref:hypothetical protein n=1 Tax=Halosimplex marinum TaxID=3396620 RepID=UPI003F564EAB